MKPYVAGSPFSPFSRQEWAAWLRAMLRVAVGTGQAPAVELVLMRDGEIAALNAAHLGCTGPTNILSFPDSAGGGRLGALALSVDTLRRECRLYGQPPAEYARRLLAHGLAHLCGYDHGPSMDAVCARLEAVAADAAIGIGGAAAGLDAIPRV